MKNFLLIILLVISSNLFAQENWTEIKPEELPEAITTNIQSDYSKYKIIKSTIKKNKEGELIYRIDLQKKKTVYHLIYNLNGILLDKTKSKSFEFDGSEKKRKPSGGNNQNEPPMMPSL